MLDAIAAAAFGLDGPDVRWIISNCDHPADVIRQDQFSTQLDPKGFWRVDKEKSPEIRRTILTLIAFEDLQESIRAAGGDGSAGIVQWIAQNDGQGWPLPEAVCLADYDLGHDDRAKQHQPVAERLGPRFLPGQLEQTAEESWRECELHARNLLGEVGFRRLKQEIEAGEFRYQVKEPVVRRVAERGETSRQDRRQSDLFGE